MHGNAGSAHCRLEMNEAVVAAEVGEQAVLLDVDTGTYFHLDQVGARIWSLIAEGRQLETIVHVLSSEYDVKIGELRRDVQAFLERLSERDLIRMAAR